MRRIALVGVVLGACARPAPAPVPAPPRAAETVGVVDAGAPVSAVEPVAADAGAANTVQKDAEEILPKVCAVSWLLYDNGQRAIGCRSHPPWTTKEQLPDGNIPVHRGDSAQICTVEAIFRGAFTRPGANEAVLAFASCWDAGGGYQTSYANAYSTVLVEETSSGWKSVAYDPIVAGGCHPARRADGHQILFCEGGMAAFSLGGLSWVYVLDYARPSQRAGSIAYYWSNLDLFECAHLDSPGTDTGGIVYTKRLGGAVRDINGDGNDDFVLEIERARVAPSPKLEAAIESCRKGNKTAVTDLVPAPTKATIEIMSSGSSFLLPTASFKTLKQWERESPAGFGGLIGAAPPPIWKP